MAEDKFHIFDRSRRREVEAAAKDLRCEIVNLDLSGVRCENDLFDALADV